MNVKLFIALLIIASLLLAACNAPTPATTAAPVESPTTPTIAPTPTSPFPPPQPVTRQQLQPGNTVFNFNEYAMLVGADGETWGCRRDIGIGGIRTDRVGGNPPMPRYIIHFLENQLQLITTTGDFPNGKLDGDGWKSWNDQDVNQWTWWVGTPFQTSLEEMSDQGAATRLFGLADQATNGELCLTNEFGLAELYPCSYIPE